MKYSDYSMTQITSELYEKIAQKLLNLAENTELKKEMSRNII